MAPHRQRRGAWQLAPRRASAVALGLTLGCGWLTGAAAVAGETTRDEPFVIERLATTEGDDQ